MRVVTVTYLTGSPLGLKDNVGGRSALCGAFNHLSVGSSDRISHRWGWVSPMVNWRSSDRLVRAGGHNGAVDFIGWNGLISIYVEFGASTYLLVGHRNRK